MVGAVLMLLLLPPPVSRSTLPLFHPEILEDVRCEPLLQCEMD